MNLINPERFPVKVVEPQCEADEKTKKKKKYLLSFWVAHNRQIRQTVPFYETGVLTFNRNLYVKDVYSMGISIPFSFGDAGSQRNKYIEASVGNLLILRKLPSK
jgi:hypothetical protein